MTTLTKRIALPLVAFAIAGLAFAGVVSAHSLSTTKAENSAQATGNKKVRDSDGDYVKATAYGCRRLFPHRVRCKVGYDTQESLPGKRFDCVDTLMMIYKAHDDDETPSYKVYYKRENSSAGRGGC